MKLGESPAFSGPGVVLQYDVEQTFPHVTKRLFDIIGASFVLFIASPIMFILAACIACDGGAIIYRHERVGKYGRNFYCLKFRSMIPNNKAVLAKHLAENPAAKAEWDATHKLKNDPRITPLGCFLRASSLDELPQLFNVLRGEMSLVGPRPIVQDEVAKYRHAIAHYYRVNPGITGLWQVSGRNNVSYAERVRMDSWYARNWSLWNDIAILFRTFPALLKRSGAY